MHPLMYILVASLASTFLGAPNLAHAADSAAQTTAVDPCANVASLTSTDNAELNKIYDDAKKLCASKTVDAIKASIDATKTAAIVDALTKFATISASSGAIAHPEKADHIGEWYAQQLLGLTVADVREKLQPHLRQNQKYIFTTDSGITARRLAIRGTLSQLGAMRNVLDELTDGVADELTVFKAPEKTPAKPGGFEAPKAFMAPLALAQTLPAAITAVQALAGLAKSEFTLTALTLDSSNLRPIVLSGLCPTGCDWLIVPGGSATGDSTSNAFTTAYGLLLKSAADARIGFSKLQRAIDKAGEDKAPESAKNRRDSLKSQIAQFETLDKAYHTIDTGKSATIFETLAQTASEILAADPATGTLIVSTNQFGGHGGTITSKWTNDRLLYEVTASMSFVLLAANGDILASGTAYASHNFINDAVPKDTSFPILAGQAQQPTVAH